MFLFRLYAIYERNKKRQCHSLSIKREFIYRWALIQYWA